MKNHITRWIKWFEDIPSSPLKVALTLLGLCFLGYGLLLPTLGLYTDDWTFWWVSDRMGPQGLQDYFAVNRPFWGLIYQFTMPLLGREPMVLHVYGLVIRWLLTFSVWGLLRVVWPKAIRQAFWVSLFFLLYPGFAIQYISLTTGNMWLVFAFLISSLLLTGLALRDRKRFWRYNTPAMILGLANILMMEYFLPLELTRLLVIYFILREEEPRILVRLRKTLHYWSPFLMMLLLVVGWRIFFFSNQTYTYSFLLIDRIKADPISGLFFLVESIAGDLFDTTFGALGRLILNPVEFHPAGMILILFLLVVIVGIGINFWLVNKKNNDREDDRKQWAWQALVFGLLSMLTAGWPFWLTELQVEPAYFNSRFTMPFILGASIFLIGLLELLPWRMARTTIMALVLGASMGTHLLIANDFRLDWVANKRLVQEIYTRIPMLEPGTTLLFDEFEFRYTSTATFAAELNLLYPPVPGMRTAYGALAIRFVDGWEEPPPDTPIRIYLIVDIFWGRVGKSVLIYLPENNTELMPSPNCVWVLDRTIIPMSPKWQALQGFSNLNLIKLEKPDWQPDPFYVQLLGLDDSQEFDCIDYQTADLARQQGDWASVVEIGDQLHAKESKLLKRLYAIVFIQANALAGDWSEAETLTNELLQRFPDYQSKVCGVWEQLNIQAPGSTEKTESLQRIRQGVCK
jgi:hypothetical protein